MTGGPAIRVVLLESAICHLCTLAPSKREQTGDRIRPETIVVVEEEKPPPPRLPSRLVPCQRAAHEPTPRRVGMGDQVLGQVPVANAGIAESVDRGGDLRRCVIADN